MAASGNTKRNTGSKSGKKSTSGSAKKKTTASSRSRAASASSARTSSAKKQTKREEDLLVHDHSEVTENIIQAGLAALCVYLFVSVIGFGGAVGDFLAMVLFGLFGLLAFVFPFAMVGGIFFYRVNEGHRYIARKMAGLIGFFISLCPFMHLLFFKYDNTVNVFTYFTQSSQTHTGGGLVGSLLIGLFGLAFGLAGAIILTLLCLVVTLILMTQRPILTNIKRKGSKEIKKGQARREHRRQVNQERRDQQREEDERILREELAALSAKEAKKSSQVSFGENFKLPGFLDKQKSKLEEKDKEAKAQETVRTKAEIVREDRELHLKEEKEEGFDAFAPKKSPKDADFSANPGVLDPGLLANINKANVHQKQAYGMKAETASLPEVTMPISDEEDMTELFASGQEDFSDIQKAFEEEKATEARTQASAKAGMASSGSLQTSDSEPSEVTEDQMASEAKEGTVKCVTRPRSSEDEIKQNVSDIQKEVTEKAEPEIVYQLPTTDLLTKPKAAKGESAEHLKETAIKLQQTFKDFGVNVRVTDVSCGPSVTRYELQPEHGVKVSRIVSLADDIKLNLAAADIRIEAPIPGKAAVGIEVPNKENTPVMMREMLESKEFGSFNKPLAFAVGKDIGGRSIVTDISKMPHLLIAGATGSGKSVCINTLIMSILFKSKPEDVRMLMIDPKVVELKIYDGIPHLLIPVVTDVKKASGALNWAVAEMTDRYQKFASFTGVRDIDSYNKRAEEKKIRKMPRILVIVDELADLMMVAPGEVEDAICRLAQLARAAGIHVIIATQRPSVNVVTGLIKANMPSRIALAVASGVDSRTILDMNGAEKLLGKGDMLFYPQGYQTPLRVQGAYIDDDDITRVVDYLKDQSSQNGNSVYNSDIEKKINEAASHSGAQGGSSEGRDEYFTEAGRLIIDKDKASIGMLQRMFKIGFNRAARIMDQLCEAGVVGPEEGTKPRTILMSQEQFENMLEQGG